MRSRARRPHGCIAASCPTGSCRCWGCPCFRTQMGTSAVAADVAESPQGGVGVGAGAGALVRPLTARRRVLRPRDPPRRLSPGRRAPRRRASRRRASRRRARAPAGVAAAGVAAAGTAPSGVATAGSAPKGRDGGRRAAGDALARAPTGPGAHSERRDHRGARARRPADRTWGRAGAGAGTRCACRSPRTRRTLSRRPSRPTRLRRARVMGAATPGASVARRPWPMPRMRRRSSREARRGYRFRAPPLRGRRSPGRRPGRLRRRPPARRHARPPTLRPESLLRRPRRRLRRGRSRGQRQARAP